MVISIYFYSLNIIMFLFLVGLTKLKMFKNFNQLSNLIKFSPFKYIYFFSVNFILSLPPTTGFFFKLFFFLFTLTWEDFLIFCIFLCFNLFLISFYFTLFKFSGRSTRIEQFKNINFFKNMSLKKFMFLAYVIIFFFLGFFFLDFFLFFFF